MRRFSTLLLPLVLVVPALQACGHKPAKSPDDADPVQAADSSSSPPAPPPAPPALFERLGKREGIEGIVDELLGNVLADKRMGKLFDKARKDKDHAKQLRDRLVDEMCVVTGGDCAYAGKPLKEAHKGMGVTDAQWDAFVEDLGIALKARSVGDAEAKELVEKLGALKADVVSAGKGK